MTDGRGLVLVTGANGFVGSHLVEALLGQGYEVRCLVRPTSDLAYIRDLPVEWAHGDLTDTTGLAEACQGVDAVCHCAALTRALDEETFMRVNTTATEALARACIDANPDLRRFVFVSSLTACGPSEGPDHYLDEYCCSQPITWYGKSKLAAERALQALGERLPLVIVRAAAVFGPRDRDFFAYFDLVNRGLRLHLGRGERLYSLIYVRDLVRFLILILESDTGLGQTYFASGPAHSYVELSDAIAQVLDRRPRPITLPEFVLTPISLWSKVQGKVTGRPALLNDQRVLDMRHRYWLCSGEKARQELGFAPEYSLEAALQETADWYLANGWL
jgi:nucleoside-diphosphate-sugar epimerase